MGFQTPHVPVMVNAADPDGTPPRRIRDEQLSDRPRYIPGIPEDSEGIREALLSRDAFPLMLTA